MGNIIRTKAIEHLARREYSRFELREKLLTENFSAAEIDAVLDDLAANHLQDDFRFAENYVRLRKQSGYGPKRIADELQQKGIANDVIKQVVDVDLIGWRRQMMSLLERRFSNVATNHQTKLRFLMNRGFHHEEIMRCLNQDRLVVDD